MGTKAFRFCLAAIVIVVALSATNPIGALIGFFCGVAIAFFIAPLMFALHGVAQAAGLTMSFAAIGYVLIATYGLCVAFALAMAGRRAVQGELHAARMIGAKAALFAALPLITYLSGHALARAWP